MKFSKLSVDKLIDSNGFECECGKTHKAKGLSVIKIGQGVINELPTILQSLKIVKPFIVTDINEYRAAGEKVETILRGANIQYGLHIIPSDADKNIAPAEFATGSIALNFDVTCDAILCVGSGVMNDLCKMISNITGKPSVVVATAPSMDGYASDCAAMEVNNIKASLKTVIPVALICDIDIMSQAPMRMLHAGLGDMIGKYSALSEWKIANMVVGDSYCAEIASLMQISLNKIIDNAKGLKEREVDATKNITEGLILSGIAMAFAGHSRPASGLDHYFSHGWEMMAIANGRECALHGLQVGVGTLFVLKIYEKLKEIKPTMERAILAADKFDENEWEKVIRRVFIDTADDIIAIAKKTRKNAREDRLQRAQKIIDNWAKIVKIAEETPSFSEIESIMKSVGMPTTAEEIGVKKEDVINAFVCSRDIRDKYLLSSMLWDIGYLDEFAVWLETII